MHVLLSATVRAKKKIPYTFNVHANGAHAPTFILPEFNPTTRVAGSWALAAVCRNQDPGCFARLQPAVSGEFVT